MRCRNACSDTCDKVAVRINEGKAIPAFQVLERHRLDQRRLASAGLSNDVDMKKAIFVFDAKDAIVIAKIDAGKASGVTCIHITHVSSLRSDARTRLGVLPKSDIRTSHSGCGVFRFYSFGGKVPHTLKKSRQPKIAL